MGLGFDADREGSDILKQKFKEKTRKAKIDENIASKKQK